MADASAAPGATPSAASLTEQVLTAWQEVIAINELETSRLGRIVLSGALYACSRGLADQGYEGAPLRALAVAIVRDLFHAQGDAAVAKILHTMEQQAP